MKLAINFDFVFSDKLIQMLGTKTKPKATAEKNLNGTSNMKASGETLQLKQWRRGLQDSFLALPLWSILASFLHHETPRACLGTSVWPSSVIDFTLVRVMDNHFDTVCNLPNQQLLLDNS